jgi:type II secretory pathway pseudopilin PulG/fibronectin type 3 domain-containing protein
MSRQSWRACRSEAGFSFVELLVTIIIAGVVFAAMVPMFVQAEKKNSGDSMRLIATQVAQDKIEKVRQLAYGSISKDNLESSTFADGQFGPVQNVSTGSGSRQIDLTYDSTSYPPGSEGLTSEYKVVTVTATWTAPPSPVKPVTLSTIVYRQYAGPPILTFATNPAMGDTGILGDDNLTTVTLSAKVDMTAGVVPSKAVFTIAAYGGATIATQTVSTTDVNPGLGYWYDGDGTFFWTWDASAAANGLYDFEVTAYSAADGAPGNSPHIYPRIEHTVPPAAPTDVSVVAGDGTVTVTWNASEEPTVESYEVYRATSLSGPWDTLLTTLPAETLAYVDDSVVNGTTYYYAVRAVTSDDERSDFAYSAAASPQAGTDSSPPTAPTSVVATKVTGSASIELTWLAATDDVGVVSYEIWRSDDGADWGSGPHDVWTNLLLLRYVDADVGYSTTWYYKIRAVDAAGNTGPFSAPVVSATTDPEPHYTLTVRNTINGNNKTRYVWVQAAATGLYYDQGGNSYSSPPTGVAVPSKNGTQDFANLPTGPYHVWVSSSNSFSSASIESPDVDLSAGDNTKDID